jgi:hypothetical protein
MGAPGPPRVNSPRNRHCFQLNGLAGDQGEEAFDLVKPRTVSGDEMHVPPRTCCQPRFDLRMLVGTVVVHDAVHVKVGRHRLVDFAQKRQEFLVPVTRFAGSEQRAVEHVQRREQRRCATALTVMSDPFNVAEAHRQHGLRTLERLTLALLVHAQDQGVLRRTQVKANHIAQFLDEELIGRELEAFAAMRLQTQQLEVTVHTGWRDSRFGSNRTYAPVRGAIRGFGVQGLVNQLSQPLIVDRARLAAPRCRAANIPLSQTSSSSIVASSALH